MRRPAARWRLGAATLALALLHPWAASADLIDEAWRRGNDATFRGDLEAAVAAYEQIARQDVASADLYYNLGVVHFRRGSLGRSIWAFERAVALAPDDEDAGFNLVQVRKLAARRVRDKLEGAERDPAWIRAITLLGQSSQIWLFVGFHLGAFVLLFLWRRARDTWRAVLGAGAALLGGAALLAGGMLIGRAALERVPFGIVLPDVAAAKEGADPNYRTSFELHAGLRVRILEQEQGWLRIRLANGLEGWLKEKDVGRL